MPGAPVHEQTSWRDITLITKGAGVNLLGGLAGTALAYLFTLVAARLAGPERYGIFVLGLGISTMGGILAGLGLKGGVLHFGAIALGQKDRERLSSVLVSGLGAAVVLGVAVWAALSLLARPLETAFGQPGLASSIRLLAIAVPFYAVSAISVGGIRAYKEMRYAVAVEELIRRSAQLGLSALLLGLGFRVVGLEVGYVGAVVVGAVVALYFLHRLFDFRHMGQVGPMASASDLLIFSVPVLGMDLLTYSQGQIETVVLGVLLPADAVAVYNVVVRNALLGVVVQSAFNLIFAPFASDLYHRNQFGQLARLFKMVTRWGFALGLPLLLVMMLFSGPILEIFGQGFSAGSVALVILAAGQLLNVGTGPVGVLITQSGRPRVNMVNTALFLGLDLALSLLLIPRYGTTGAALAGALSIGGVNLLRLVQVRVLLHMHPYHAGFLKPAAAGLCAAGFWAALKTLDLPISDLPGWVLGAVAVLGVYLAVLVALGLNEEDRAVLRAVGRRVLPVSWRGGS